MSIDKRYDMSYDGRLRSGMMYYYSDIAARALVTKLVLKDDVIEEALVYALTQTAKRHPHITKSLREENGNYYMVDNDRPISVLKKDEGLVLGGKEANYHLYGITYNSNVLRIYWYHGLMDGMASQRVLETLLYYYFSKKNEKDYEPEGIWINDGTSYEGYNSEPYEKEYEVDSSKISELSFDPDNLEVLHLKQLDEGFGKGEHTGFEVKISSEEFMGFVKREGLTPTSASAVFLSNAAQSLYPDNTKPIKTAMPVDIRRAIGLPNTYKNATLDIGLYYEPQKMMKMSHSEQGRILRAQLKQQVAPDYIRRMVNASRRAMMNLEEIGGYNERVAELGKIKRTSVDTVFLSYVGSLHLPGYEDEVMDLSLLSHSRNSIIIDLVEMNGYFIFGFRQCVSSSFFVDEFVSQLQKAGINAKCSESEKYSLPYVEFRESIGLK